ncbi:MAG: hypothetical protein ABID61_02440 [Candidatus Micrarchaeota archaeon]
MLFLSGCALPLETQQNKTTTQTCRIIQTDKPVTTEECVNYTKTSTDCNERQMYYSILSLSKNTLCTADGSCAGKSIENCGKCSTAMTRCIMTINSDEQKESGTITVGANFTLPSGAFLKEPISKTFNHGTNDTFDFYQIYNPGNPINTADCNLYVIGIPTVNECNDITKIVSDCKPVTRIEKIQTEICS